MPSKAARGALALAVAAAATLALLSVTAPPQGAPLRHSKEAEEHHRVRSLPGWGALRGLSLFSGSLPVAKDKALFYAFVEAEHHPRDAPVVLWLTGGPGCSSVATAFLAEHGPFYPRPGSSSRLERNAWSYHSLPAHMVYLDAPAGVGFSSSNSSDDDVAGDKGMARDVVAFLHEWRKLYPQLRGNPLWLAGESYAGHYVPHIALRLLKHNEEAVGAERIDFRGFLLGNPSTDSIYDNEGRLTYWWSHGLISQDVKKEVEHSCDFSEVIITPGIEVKTRKESKACRKAVEDAISEMGPIDIQNVFIDKCMSEEKGGGTLHKSSPESLPQLLRGGGGGGAFVSAAANWLLRRRRASDDVDPCINDEAEAYLARRDVQDALHANTSGELDWAYQGCTEGTTFKYDVDDQLESMLPLHREIMEKAPKLRVLIYTGDADALVPLTGTRRWVFELGTEEGKKKKTHWRHWEDARGQVGGYLEEYEGFTFATIRRAGHEAPYTAKGRTFFIYKTWLSGKDIV